ncbi:MAG: SPFH domain-containing protein [Oscillospiraceae bacterium]|nr:SPFH domain-containing protein [Oscillospiraceae bacterium]
MGLIRAVKSAVGGGLADQWLEVIEADNLSPQTVMTRGVTVRQSDARNRNRKGTDNTISNGSIIHVYPNQCMLLVDGGKIVDYSAEPGYYKVEDSSLPSMFGGQFGDSLKETFQRVKFGGVTPRAQIAIFINLQEIRDIAFGTVNPVNYFDEFFNAELFFRAFGYFSLKITEPLKFYAEVVDKGADRMDVESFKKMLLAEFLGQFQAALNRMSSDGVRASHVVGKTAELTNYMREIMDEDWRNMRGIEVQSVGLKSISYCDETKELMKLRNQGAMLQDASIREGFVQGAAARGLEAAGSNAGGAMTGFLGMGLGMQATGLGQMTAGNQAQIQQQQAAAVAPAPNAWACTCGQSNTGNFCQGCGGAKPAPATGWTCACGQVNTGNFCQGCGTAKPIEPSNWTCKCGQANTGNFCQGCGGAKA